jgi:ParB-like chromosome segregation protein Spo0J
VGLIVDALQEVGAARSIVIDEDGTILAGNATCEAAAEAGLTKVQVVDADGETIVAVRRTGLTPAQKAKLALYDNRAAELAEGWNADVLAELATELDLSQMFSVEELAKLTGDESAAGDDAESAYDSQWMIVLTCKSEDHQRDLLDRFLAEGLQCRAVAS